MRTVRCVWGAESNQKTKIKKTTHTNLQKRPYAPIDTCNIFLQNILISSVLRHTKCSIRCVGGAESNLKICIQKRLHIDTCRGDSTCLLRHWMRSIQCVWGAESNQRTQNITQRPRTNICRRDPMRLVRHTRRTVLCIGGAESNQRI